MNRSALCDSNWRVCRVCAQSHSASNVRNARISERNWYATPLDTGTLPPEFRVTLKICTLVCKGFCQLSARKRLSPVCISSTLSP
jgi:hypothetical protein